MQDQKGFPTLVQSIILVAGLLLLMVGTATLLAMFPVIPVLYTLTISYVISFGLITWIGYSKKRNSGSGGPLSWRFGSLRLGLLVLLTGILLNLCMDPLTELVPMPEELLDTLRSVTDGSIVSFVLVVLAPALLEELLFRGVILEGLSKQMSPFRAILISSILFGLAHANYVQFIGALIAGSFFGWVYLRTGSILYPVLMHGLNNLLGWILLTQGVYEMSLVDLIGNPVIYYFLILGTAGITAYFVFILSKHLRPIGIT